MDRNEFTSTLRAVLTGEVPASVVEDYVRYYEAYISQEIASGKSEREVMESLGDPRLIARTIIDTQRQQDGYQENGSGQLPHFTLTTLTETCSSPISVLLPSFSAKSRESASVSSFM